MMLSLSHYSKKWEKKKKNIVNLQAGEDDAVSFVAVEPEVVSLKHLVMVSPE